MYEKIVAPWSTTVKSWRWGIWYLSGTVTLLRARKSPHGRQSSGVRSGTICSGDDQLLSEGRIIPNCSMWSNSCCAILNCSGANLLVRVKTGGAVVVMRCITVCFTRRSPASHQETRIAIV